MKVALNKNYQSEGLSEEFPLSNEQVRKTCDVLARSGCDARFLDTFRTIYEADRIAFEDEIKGELALVHSQNPSIPESALAFIEALSLSGNEKLIEKLVVKYAIGVEESAAVCYLLTLNDVIKTAFVSRMNALHQTAVKSMTRLPASVVLANEFIGAFDIPVPTQTRSEKARCEALLKKILEVVHRQESMIGSPLVSLLKGIGEDHNVSVYPDDFVIQACLLFSQDNVREWFKERKVEWMPDALFNTFKKTVNNFNSEMEIKLFMSLVKAKSRLSDQALECLDCIFDVLQEAEQGRIIHRLKTNTNISKLTGEEIDAVKSLLDDSGFTKILTSDRMSERIRRLRSAFDQMEAAPGIHTTGLKMLTQ